MSQDSGGIDNELRIQIMGSGSLGSLIGGLLSRSGVETTLIGREEHVEAVNKDGLKVTEEFEFTTHPDAYTKPQTADITLVTVKAFDTREAAELLKEKQKAVVSLQNGMGNEEILEETLDAEVLAGTTTYGANLVEPGVVECTGVGEVNLGGMDGETDTSRRLARLMRDAGIDTYSRPDMHRRLWEKLAVNAGINPVTALTRLTNGEAAEECGDLMRKAAEETARVARSHGVKIDAQDASRNVTKVAEATHENESSMLQDVKQGRRTEIGAINGYVVRSAVGGEGETENEDEKIDVRINTTLTRLVKGLEKSYLEEEDFEPVSDNTNYNSKP